MSATRLFRNATWFAAALCLSLTLGLSGARALTDCPGQSNGVPGPFYVLFAVGSYQIDADGMAKIREAAKLAKDMYIRTVCVRGKADNRATPITTSPCRSSAPTRLHPP